jgi:hypothetical protein
MILVKRPAISSVQLFDTPNWIVTFWRGSSTEECFIIEPNAARTVVKGQRDSLFSIYVCAENMVCSSSKLLPLLRDLSLNEN